MQTGKKLKDFTKFYKSMNIQSNDFYKVPNIKFDIFRLKADLEKILAKKKFNSLGIKNFGAISLTQVPGDPDSIKGNKARGVFWTKPDSSGRETIRDEMIDESAYSEFIDDYKHTYFKEVFDILSSNYKLGRVRVLLK